jgi:putative RNA 2'-phosphotransferase
MSASIVSTSKLLSLILRHKPEEIGLSLDSSGWADIDELLRLTAAKGKPLTRAIIDEIVVTNDKKRFFISTDGTKIRANQGHSIPVELGLPSREPPAMLFHGTATRFVESIQKRGLLKGNRQHVHYPPTKKQQLRLANVMAWPLCCKLPQ